MCAALIVEPMFAKSVAATVINSGAAVTNDISFLSTGPHRSIGTARRGKNHRTNRHVSYGFRAYRLNKHRELCPLFTS
jgi:hypothetical protein